MVEVVTQVRNFSQGVIVPAGSKMLFSSGHVPSVGGQPVEGGFKVQVETVFKNLDETLKKAGGKWDDVVKLTYFICNFDRIQMPIIAEVRDQYINTEASPTMSMIGVTKLAHPDYLIEIELVAILQD